MIKRFIEYEKQLFCLKFEILTCLFYIWAGDRLPMARKYLNNPMELNRMKELGIDEGLLHVLYHKSNAQRTDIELKQ